LSAMVGGAHSGSRQNRDRAPNHRRRRKTAEQLANKMKVIMIMGRDGNAEAAEGHLPGSCGKSACRAFFEHGLLLEPTRN